jgi:23S rRNA (cytidine1920-2'-O)/16S rRNA (cytidine1409-2'-O)-methyltransferase
MAARRRQPFISLTRLLRALHPELGDPEQAVREHRVLVDGRTVTNVHGQVRRDATVRVLPRRRLRGDAKLTVALEAFDLDITGLIAVDVGAAAGGFTTALLRRGVRRVYAVDTGFGQLLGSLRIDPRVVNLERTNVAALDAGAVPEPVDLVTIDVSYTSIASALDGLRTLAFAPDARLVALVKPTFELRAGRLVTDRRFVETAIRRAIHDLDATDWTTDATTLPTVTGRHGAIEAFVVASRKLTRPL